MSKAKFQNRWVENADHKQALLKVIKITQKGGVLKKEHSPYGILENGLIDFRGLRLSGLDIKKLKIIDADLSFSDFHDTILERSVFKNVRFHQVDFSKLRDWGNDFVNVQFLKCNFKEAGMGYKGSKYKLSIIEECNFNRANFLRAEFSNCKIIKCKLKGMDFSGSSFEECAFVGKYEDLWFRGGYAVASYNREFGKPKKNKMKNVSFEEANLIYTTFSNNCDLSTVKLPKTGNYKYFDHWEKRLKFLSSKISNWSEEEYKEADTFVFSCIGHAKTQKNYIINVDEIKKDYGEKLTEKMIFELENAL